MQTAAKYRQEFYEKEDIFEKFLPFAIMFGLTSLWIRKMKDLYGENYFKNYHPVWFSGSFISFEAGSIDSFISSISSSIASTMVSSPFGSGSRGSSGGGGGW